MSLEEFADREVEDAMKRQEKQKKNENDPNRPGTLFKKFSSSFHNRFISKIFICYSTLTLLRN